MVFVKIVCEHMFVNSVRVPGLWINLDRVLLMQPIYSLDQVHMDAPDQTLVSDNQRVHQTQHLKKHCCCVMHSRQCVRC